MKRVRDDTKRWLGMRGAATLFALALIGCASAGVQIDQSKLGQFQKGRTTAADVIAALGRPTQATTSSNGTQMLIYSYYQIQARPETFIPYIGAFVGGADSKSSVAVFNFGPDGTLASYVTSNSGIGVGTGLAPGGGGVQTAQQPHPSVPTGVPTSARRELGIRAAKVTDSLASSVELGPPRGLAVISVDRTGAAYDAGIQAGDIILTFGDTPVLTAGDVQAVLATIRPNDTVTMQIWHDRTTKSVQLQF